MTFQGTVNLHPCVKLEHALLNTAVCHANHLAITAAKRIPSINYNLAILNFVKLPATYCIFHNK